MYSFEDWMELMLENDCSYKLRKGFLNQIVKTKKSVKRYSWSPYEEFCLIQEWA